MKKFLKYAFFLMFCAVCLLVAVPKNISYSYAIDTTGARSTAVGYLNEFVQYGAPLKTTVNRTAGSYGEQQAALQIQLNLESLGLEAKNDGALTINGEQSFSFYSYVTYKKEISQNIIYTIKGKSSAKKVVLSTNYDNLFIGYLSQEDDMITEGEAYSEGINASAASVAVMLTLAEILPQNYFDFDIEFVFFGAGYNDNDGAKYYNQTMDKTERDKTLLMLDISRVALGEELYYYSGNFGSVQDEFYVETLNNLIQYKAGIHGSSTEDYSTDLGYANAGYSGSTAVFEGSGLNVLHLFAGTYNKGLFSGYCEYSNKINITNTENDNLDYIIATLQSKSFANVEKAILGITKLLDNQNFVEQLSKQNSTWQYKVFSNKVDINFILLIMIIIFMIISIIIHYSITKKTYKYIEENKINGVMLKIDEPENVGKNK